MTMPGCFGARNVVAIRASRIEADGSRICPSIDGSAAMTGGVISFSATLRIDTGQTDLQRDGDGNVCNTRTSADVVTGIDLTVEICKFDWEMLETLTGGVLDIVGGQTNGWEYPLAADTPPHTEFHAWARTWDGAGQAAAAQAYTHLGYFNTTWTPPTINLQENALTLPLTGKGAENSNISIGSFNDIPPEFVGAVGGAWWAAAADLPDDPNPDGLSCGYIDTPACSSS